MYLYLLRYFRRPVTLIYHLNLKLTIPRIEASRQLKIKIQKYICNCMFCIIVIVFLQYISVFVIVFALKLRGP